MLVLFQTKLKHSKCFQITQNLILWWRSACILALHHLCSSERHHSWWCSRWHCCDWNFKHGWEHSKMQWNLQSKVDLRRFLKKQDQCCQWLMKWSAALVCLLSHNRQALVEMRGLWYSLFCTLEYQNFSASWPWFFTLFGMSNSSWDTDPSVVNSLSCFSSLCLWYSFSLGFPCTQNLKLACR